MSVAHYYIFSSQINALESRTDATFFDFSILVPFVIPFETRVAIFRQFVSNDRQRLQLDRAFYHRPEVYRIRRDHISEDSYAHLNGLGPKIKGRIAISFIDEFGEPEIGIDGGGLYK